MNNSLRINDLESDFAAFDALVVSPRHGGRRRRHSLSTAMVPIKKELDRLPLENSVAGSITTAEETESENSFNNSWSSAATGCSNSSAGSGASCIKLAPSKIDNKPSRRRRRSTATPSPVPPPPVTHPSNDKTQSIRERRSIRRNKSVGIEKLRDSHSQSNAVRRTRTSEQSSPAMGHTQTSTRLPIRRNNTAENPMSGGTSNGINRRTRPQRRASLAAEQRSSPIRRTRTMVESKDTAQIFSRLGKTLGEK